MARDGDDKRTVRTERDGELLWLVLDRPERLNALCGPMREEITEVLDQAARGPWRCLLIRGEGRAFCAGADLAQFVDEVDLADAEAVRTYLAQGWQEVAARLRELPLPVVSAVHGAAYGGGANLALAADLVVAAESATFCEPYVTHGISPDCGATWLLPRLVGAQHTRRLLLLGEPIAAHEAARIGLVAEVVPDGALLARARQVGTALAAKDPKALQATRELLELNQHADLRTALAREAETVAALLGGPAFRHATARFRKH